MELFFWWLQQHKKTPHHSEDAYFYTKEILQIWTVNTQFKETHTNQKSVVLVRDFTCVVKNSKILSLKKNPKQTKNPPTKKKREK